MSKSPQPTDGEMAILQVLWRRGPSTVRAVHDEMQEQRTIGYTTVLKMLQIMLGKGIVDREDSRRPHVYRPAQPPEQVQEGLVAALARKAFGGSAASLVMRALSSKATSRDELREIRSLLDSLDGGEE